MSRENTARVLECGRQFASTRWNLVLAAVCPESEEARSAWEALCQLYWYPLYAYVRRRGYRTEDAQDLTQEFLARLLETDALRAADPATRSISVVSFGLVAKLHQQRMGQTKNAQTGWRSPHRFVGFLRR